MFMDDMHVYKTFLLEFLTFQLYIYNHCTRAFCLLTENKIAK